MITFKLFPEKIFNSKGKVKIKYPLSTNDFYSGRHWTFRKTQADYWHQLIKVNISFYEITESFLDGTPVDITIKFNDRLDIDNHSAMAKLIIDGLKGIIIIDDTRRFVKSLTMMFYNEEGIEVTII